MIAVLIRLPVTLTSPRLQVVAMSAFGMVGLMRKDMV